MATFGSLFAGVGGRLMPSTNHFVVFRSDPLCHADLPVRRCATRAEAVALVARLNRRAAAAYGRPRPGKPIPLYFCERAG
jgi:hypothetical protein